MHKRQRVLWTVCVCLCLCVSVCGSGCEPAPTVQPIAKALVCGCPHVTVEGVLDNRSDNYFSNPKFMVKDASGEVEVRAWLPLEVAPYHPDVVEEIQRRGGKWPPETMAAYLGGTVRMTGHMEDRKDAPPILVVEQAEKVK